MAYIYSTQGRYTKRQLCCNIRRRCVSVNAIAPGGIATPGTAAPLAGSGMTQEELDAMMAGFAARIPMGRMREPDDIGKVAAFLASSASDYMTGEVVVVDGGMLLS
ncbi:MAG: SDR family oxidoreductase [Coriobacteriia bacterium]|nr:SDR family oxidoreductase [Coriobacteriia bacterium]